MEGKKKRKGFEKHLVPCPNCGKDVLDHMTQCPFCKVELTPVAYRPPDPEKLKKIKIILSIIGFIIAAIVLIIVRFGK